MEASRSYRTDIKEHTNTCSHILRLVKLECCSAPNLLLGVIMRRYRTTHAYSPRHRDNPAPLIGCDKQPLYSVSTSARRKSLHPCSTV